MSDVAEKWGEAVAQRGFAQVPNYLLLANQFLDEDNRLTPVELLVLLQLVGSWWRKDELPFPSVSTLAIRCGVSGRQIQRAVGQLEKRGLVQRVSRRARGLIASNAYDLSPLATTLEKIAKAFPNAFPRNIDLIRRKRLIPSDKVAPPSEAAKNENSAFPKPLKRFPPRGLRRGK